MGTDSGFIRRYPSSDITAEWTKSEGASNFGCVNRVRPLTAIEGQPSDNSWNYDDSAYVSGENGDMDIYGITPFSFDAATKFVDNFQIFLRGESTVDEDYFEVYLRVNGINYMVDDTYAFYMGGASDVTFYLSANPDSSLPWTIDDLNGIGDHPLQGIGIKNIGSGTMTLYGVWLEVETHYETTVTVISDVSVQWTPSEGSDNYAMVDKTDTDSPPSTDTYNSALPAEGSPKVDKFTFTGFGIPSNARFDYLYFGLYFHTRVGITGASNGIKLNGWVNGTKYSSGELTPLPGWSWYPWMQPFADAFYNINPDTSSEWVANDLNGTGSNPLTHIGCEDVYILGDGSVRIAQIAATVRYRVPLREYPEIGSKWPLPCFTTHNL